MHLIKNLHYKCNTCQAYSKCDKFYEHKAACELKPKCNINAEEVIEMKRNDEMKKEEENEKANEVEDKMEVEVKKEYGFSNEEKIDSMDIDKLPNDTDINFSQNDIVPSDQSANKLKCMGKKQIIENLKLLELVFPDSLTFKNKTREKALLLFAKGYDRLLDSEFYYANKHFASCFRLFKSKESLYNYLLNYIRLNDKEGVAKLIRNKGIQSKQGYNLLGLYYTQQKKYEMAQKNYLKAIDIDKFYLNALYNLFDLYNDNSSKLKDQTNKLNRIVTKVMNALSYNERLK